MPRTVAHALAPFYYHARAWFDLPSDELDRLLVAHSRAEITSPGVLTITTPGPDDNSGAYAVYRAPKHLRQRSVAAWVREFNRRAAR